MMWKGRSRSIEKTEYDEYIKNGQGYKMLENELKNCIVQMVDEPSRQLKIR